jgi:hypothetical protein
MVGVFNPTHSQGRKVAERQGYSSSSSPTLKSSEFFLSFYIMADIRVLLLIDIYVL